MYTVTRELTFSYGHRLLNYEGKCARLHGHNGRLRVTLASASLDRVGMVVDFAEIKRSIREWIEDALDHRLILHREDPAVGALESIGESLYVVDFNPTAENIARHIHERLAARGLPVIEVSLGETENCSASFRSEPPETAP